MDYFKIPYNGSEKISVSEFLNTYQNGFITDISVSEFLNYSDGVSTNLDKIIFVYDVIEKSLYDKHKSYNIVPDYIKPNTELIIPKSSVLAEKVALYSQNQVISQKGVTAFLGEYKNLINKDGYIKSESLTLPGKGVDLNVINLNIRVWIWVRAIDRIVDVSAFITTLTTNKTDVGNFSFSLLPVLDIDNIDYINGNNVLNYFSINSRDKFGENTHNIDFFEKNLQKNDIVFIRFEQLKLESKEDSYLKNKTNLYISKNDIYNVKNSDESRVWDMIGLIDSTSVSYNSRNLNKNISVSGRDFMKLFLEDGSYFLPFKYMEGKDVENKFVWGQDQNDDWFKRSMVSGDYIYFFSYEMKPIIDSLKFIINHLSNLGVCPDNLFSGYGKDITKVYRVGEDESYLNKKNVKGVWQIIRIITDPTIEDRTVASDGLQNPEGTLFQFVNQICQKPFVEFWGDTFTNKFDLMIRQPPYNKEAIRNVYNNGLYIKIKSENLLSYNLDFDTTYYTHYQIEPQDHWAGIDKGIFQAIIPIIYFTKYASVFGNKRMYTKDIYLSLSTFYGKDKSGKQNNFIEAILNDYKYMVETTMYLPFTRTGSITLNGDRRIKKGMFVYLEATKELFVVDSVTNSYSVTNNIDRTTSIRVSRGMKVDYINERIIDEYNTKKASYFNIIDVDLIINDILRKTLINSEDSENGAFISQKKDINTNFTVDENIFEFFLNRKHFR